MEISRQEVPEDRSQGAHGRIIQGHKAACSWPATSPHGLTKACIPYLLLDKV